MTSNVLEEVVLTTPTSPKICNLKLEANKIANHYDKKLLLPRWEPCIKCTGYDTTCPGYS